MRGIKIIFILGLSVVFYSTLIYVGHKSSNTSTKTVAPINEQNKVQSAIEFDENGIKIFCRTNNKKWSKETLQKLIDEGNLKITITQDDVDYFNNKPTCLEFCNEQLRYSKKYDDWFAEDDLRGTCKSLGIILPE